MPEDEIVGVIVDGSPAAITAVVDACRFYPPGDEGEIPDYIPDQGDDDHREVHWFNTSREVPYHAATYATAGAGKATVYLLDDDDSSLLGVLTSILRSISIDVEEMGWTKLILDPTRGPDSVAHL